jgi:hypothetical protein
MEIQDQTERGYRSHLDEGGLRDTHVRFLLGDFDERTWGQRLAQAEKRRKRDAEVQEVFAAFRMVAVELLNRIQHYRDETVDTFTRLPSPKAEAYLEVWNKEVQALIQMVNEGLKAVSIAHHCVTPYINVGYLTNRTIYYQYVTLRWTETTARSATDQKGPVEAGKKGKVEPEVESEELEEPVEEPEVEPEEESDDERAIALAVERSLLDA